MPKIFYTEQDIEDMARRGVLSLDVDDQVVLTDLAYEKARSLGMALNYARPDQPPASPVRPYIAKDQNHRAAANGSGPGQPSAPADLHQRIRGAVLAQLGDRVDPALLDEIIRRVIQSMGLK